MKVIIQDITKSGVEILMITDKIFILWNDLKSDLDTDNSYFIEKR